MYMYITCSTCTCTLCTGRALELVRIRRILKAKSTSFGRPDNRERVSLDRPKSVSIGEEGGREGGREGGERREGGRRERESGRQRGRERVTNVYGTFHTGHSNKQYFYTVHNCTSNNINVCTDVNEQCTHVPDIPLVMLLEGV